MSVRKLILLILAVLLAFTAWDAIGWYASPNRPTIHRPETSKR